MKLAWHGPLVSEFRFIIGKVSSSFGHWSEPFWIRNMYHLCLCKQRYFQTFLHVSKSQLNLDLRNLQE